MADLDERFRVFERASAPDLWADIVTREPRPVPDRGRRGIAAVAALAIAAVGVAVAIRAFAGRDTSPPARLVARPPAPVEPVVNVTLPIRWPSSIVYGEGSVWVAASANDGTGAGTVFRIDPDTAEILAEIEVPSVPGWEFGGGGMEVAAGSLWIAGYLDRGDQGALLRVDTATEQLADVVPLGGQFAGDVAVDDDAIWVTVFGEPSVEVLRLNPSTLTIERRSSLGEDWVRELLLVDGHLWVRSSQDTLAKIEPINGTVASRVEVPGGVTSVATFQDAVWAATWKAGPGYLLARIEPATGALDMFRSESLGHLIESGESGLWGRWDPGGGTLGIGRFDPVTGTVDASVGLQRGSDPIAMAVAPGSVWVATYQVGVTRIELRPA
jgi:streptogramin lyase